MKVMSCVIRAAERRSVPQELPIRHEARSTVRQRQRGFSDVLQQPEGGDSTAASKGIGKNAVSYILGNSRNCAGGIGSQVPFF
jgi:hypothetical protein